MKIKHLFNLNDHLVQFQGLFLALILLLVPLPRASAANLFWDAGNTNNGATIDPASGFWDLTHVTTNFTATTTTTTTNDANLGAGGIDWFQVNVPANALAATNTLLYATNLPVNVWFSTNVPPTTTNAGDALLIPGATNGVSVLTTNSAPPNIVQGGTYYLGVANTNNVAVGYALQVDLSLTNAVTITSPLLNWNTGTANVSWTQTSTTSNTNSAVFNGPNGNYSVVLDNGQIAFSNLFVNAAGYTFSGSELYWANSAGFIIVTDGVSVVFNNLVGGNNATHDLQMGSNGPAGSVTFLGGFSGTQPHFTSTNGSILYMGTNFSDGVCHIACNLWFTNGTWASGGGLIIGNATGNLQPGNAYGSVTIDGANTVVNHTSDYISIGRGNGNPPYNATLTIQNGATVNYQTGLANNNLGIGLPRPGSTVANGQSWLNVYGGLLQIGPGTEAAHSARPIYLANGGSVPGQIAALTQTGGVINAWSGIQFGGSGTYSGGIAAVTNSGGFLYIGAYNGEGLKLVKGLPLTNYITLSGGTVGALANWQSSATGLPITLATLNGNITFQCADASATPWNIALAQALTGPGGFNKTGGGTLTLNGVNTYAGSTVVSNGTLVLTTASTASSNGPVTLDGSAGSPDLVLHVSAQGQYWSIGTNIFQNATLGTPQIDFQWGGLTPSKTVAPIQVNGDLDFTAPPNMLFTNASQLFNGAYPLFQYSGNFNGSLPGNITLPANFVYPAGGVLSNSPAAKTLYLVVSNSPVSPNLFWAVCNGTWDFSSLNWKLNGNPVAYADGDPVVFNDSNTCVNPVITLNTTVSPLSVTFDNFNDSYAIIGTGNIAGGASVSLLGSGPVALATTNTYSGGTTVAGGSLLNINSGGNASGSPVGTGTLALYANAQLGNSSGSAVALQYPVAQLLNGSFSFVGTNDLNLGSGAVSMAQSLSVNVVTNDLIIAGNISDNGNSYDLIKTGNGTLTLGGNNFWTAFELNAGQVNANSGGALGSGSVQFNGGVVDNTSGAAVVLTAASYQMSTLSANNPFVFNGTTNLDLGSGTINANNAGTIGIVVVSNTLSTAGMQVGNTVIVKSGNGIWSLGGADAVNNAVVTVNQGEFDMNRLGGNPAIGTGGGGSYGGSHGLVVNSNTLAKITGTLGNQISHGVGGNSYVEVILNTGALDLNGNSQAVDMIAMTNGILRNSADITTSLLTINGTLGTHPTNAITLTGACLFDTPLTNAILNVAAIVNGAGSLVKTGFGTVTLQQSNAYTGNITVNAGTLSTTFEDFAATATVTIANNAVLNLNYADLGTNTVAGLVLNGTNAPAGLYNATTSPAFISGAGNLLVVPPPPVVPGPIYSSVSAGVLNLWWPTNAGFSLQAQTNPLAKGLATNWVTIPGSALITNISIPMNVTNGATFYRLFHP